jgi:hypothetical protein
VFWQQSERIYFIDRIFGQANYEAALMDDVIGNRNVLTITFDNVRLYSSTPTASMKDGAHEIVDKALEEFFYKNQMPVKEPSHGYSHESKALRATCEVGGCKMRH